MERTRQVTLQMPRDEAFTACRDAAQRLDWVIQSDGAEGGLDIDVPRDDKRLRPTAKVEVRLHDVAPDATRVTIKGSMGWRRPAGDAQLREIVQVYRDVLQGDEPSALTVGSWSAERLAIRALTVALLATAVVLCLTLEIPTELPAVALGQASIYRLQLALAVFYGGLIILTPFFFGAIRGRLPIEVSTRGAKFAEDVDESIKKTQDLVDELRQDIDQTNRRVTRARLNIDQLASGSGIELVE